MAAPRSIRFEQDTLDRLKGFASRHSGMTVSGAAALLAEEGLRMDAHPGVLFRDGPAGRRAGLVGGPDVWEVVRAVKSARSAEPTLPGPEVLNLVRDLTGLSESSLTVALDYYGHYAQEIDEEVQEAEDVESATESALSNTMRLLGA